MATTIIDTTINVQYEELDGSPQESYSDDGAFEATRTLQCDWASRETLINQLLGDTIATDSDVVISRAHKYPGNPLAVAKNVSGVQGIGRIMSSSGDATVASYEKARLQVKYVQTKYTNSVNNPPGQDPNIYSETFKPSIEYIPVPNDRNQSFYPPNGSQGQELKQNPSVQIISPGAEWQITKKKLRSIPAGLWDMVGHINSGAVYSTWFNCTFQAETLLGMPFDISREVLRSGQGLWTITAKMVYKPNYFDGAYQGWNGLNYLDANFKHHCTKVYHGTSSSDQYIPYKSTSFASVIAALQGA